MEIAESLESRRYIVRLVAANMGGTFADRRNKKMVKAVLAGALKDETTVAAREAIERALKEVQSKQ